jgi:hypothetical protein
MRALAADPANLVWIVPLLTGGEGEPASASE